MESLKIPFRRFYGQELLTSMCAGARKGYRNEDSRAA